MVQWTNKIFLMSISLIVHIPTFSDIDKVSKSINLMGCNKIKHILRSSNSTVIILFCGVLINFGSVVLYLECGCDTINQVHTSFVVFLSIWILLQFFISFVTRTRNINRAKLE